MTDLVLSSPADLIRSKTVPASLRRAFRMLLGLEVGQIDIVLPDGRAVRFSGGQPGPKAKLVVRSYAFLRRLVGGDAGFAEGYIADEWTTPDLVALLSVLTANQHLIDRFAANPIVRAAQMFGHWLNRNSRRGSRRNIHAHYDLGNAFYAQWLDPSMTYSAGLGVGDDLEAAQRRKYAAIAAMAGIEPHHHVLEIGCGWGGFAEYAAREIGCRVTALTISDEQFDYGTRRIAEAGLSDRVDIGLRDYRDETARYDAVVSIEMFEAVGQAYWRGFFETLRARMKPGARAALQVITIREDIFPRYRREMDFIRRYVFPGGMLPTPTHLRDLGSGVGLALCAERGFGADYAATCRIWRDRFEASWEAIAPLGFDERFRRMWRYYLDYCQAGFAVGTIDVRHIAYVAPAAGAR